MIADCQGRRSIRDQVLVSLWYCPIVRFWCNPLLILAESRLTSGGPDHKTKHIMLHHTSFGYLAWTASAYSFRSQGHDRTCAVCRTFGSQTKNRPVNFGKL